MATKTSKIVRWDGPFFTKDPKATFRQNARKMLAAVAAEGEGHVRNRLREGEPGRRPLHGLSPDRVSGHVIGRVRSLSGTPWMLWAKVSVNNSGLSATQGKTLMAAASILERRTHAFRRMTTAMRSAKSANLEHLLDGLD